MASLNTSQNGPSITKSYQSIVNSPPPSGAAGSSPTYGQWAVLVVSAPLVSAFQNDGGKESVLKVQSTGEGELIDLIEDFSDGRIQFAFVKVKDPNTSLPKNILISWCGDGVPERTKGYFNSHRTVVSNLLHGYHVEITARSDRDLTPESIIQKVADASGAKYGGGGGGGGDSLPSVSSSGPPPPSSSSRPVFTPTRTGGGGSGFNPLGGRSRGAASSGPTDEDGWGDDAPQVTRTQLEKVQPAYQPTKVNLADLTSKREPSRYTAPEPTNNGSDVVKGGYQPIGKVDLNEIRRQARESGTPRDDRPTIVKGAYEPVGKVDIAAIRARAQKPADDDESAARQPPATSGGDEDERPQSLADRSAAFQSSGRVLTEMPKPKVANRFGSSNAFSGTKAPAPGGFDPLTREKAAPIGIASRTFADEGGKTPAQIWAEKKARQSGGGGGGGLISPSTTGTAPVASQKSGDGGWKSGYAGKSWAPVQTTRTGQSAASNLSEQRTGHEDQESASPAGGVGSIRDRFSGSAAQPPIDMSNRPRAGSGAARGIAIPGMGSQIPAEHHVDVPSPPAVPRSPSPEPEEEDDDFRPRSPIRVAMPVSRATKEQPELEPAREPEKAIPTASLAKVASRAAEQEDETEDFPARGAAQASAESSFGAGAAQAAPGAAKSGRSAVAQYDYEKTEDNELELTEGQAVHNIEMVDEDWWMGTNEKGESGLFPSNYVELIEEDQEDSPPSPAAAAQSRPAQETAPPPGPPQAAGGTGKTATAQYDYEAAEENELSFPDGAKIQNVEFPDEDWWFGEYRGKSGLFPANYVQIDE